ncbi:hypothetical protein GWO13_09630 [Candidatus Bathyarchaeota archaeon]|nr:hypothetical protein [Candidatus Bathyarchaeota archaeon]
MYVSTERSKRANDFLGTVLGILGNLFAEYFIASTYPEGIPQDAALGGTYVMVVFIIVYALLVASVIRKTIED